MHVLMPMPMSPPRAQARIETGFVSRFVAPFFTSMRKQLPQLACCEETISSNLELWADVADGTQAGPLDGAEHTPAEGAADCHAASHVNKSACAAGSSCLRCSSRRSWRSL